MVKGLKTDLKLLKFISTEKDKTEQALTLCESTYRRRLLQASFQHSTDIVQVNCSFTKHTFSSATIFFAAYLSCYFLFKFQMQFGIYSCVI